MKAAAQDARYEALIALTQGKTVRAGGQRFTPTRDGRVAHHEPGKFVPRLLDLYEAAIRAGNIQHAERAFKRNPSDLIDVRCAQAAREGYRFAAINHTGQEVTFTETRPDAQRALGRNRGEIRPLTLRNPSARKR